MLSPKMETASGVEYYSKDEINNKRVQIFGLFLIDF